MNPLLLAIALRPTAADTISFSHDAAPLPVVLRELGKQTGLELAAHDRLAKTYILIDFEDVRIEEALSKIAYAVQGTWNAVGSGRQLVAPSHEELARPTYAALARQLESRYAEPQELSEAERREYVRTEAETDQASNALSHRSAESRFISRIIRSLGHKNLARAISGERLVWNSHPTSRQMPLPVSFGSAYDYWRKDYAEQVRIAKSIWKSELLENLKPPVEPAMWHLVVTGSIEHFTLSILGFDSAGEPVFDEGISDNWTLEPTGSSAPVLADSSGTLKMGDLSRELIQAQGRLLARKYDSMASASLKAMLEDAEANELLAALPQETIVQAAFQAGRSVVTVLPDELISAFVGLKRTPNSDDKIPLARSLAKISAPGSFLNFVLDGEWMLGQRASVVGKPLNFSRKLLQETVKVGFPASDDIDGNCILAAKAGSALGFQQTWTFCRLVQPTESIRRRLGNFSFAQAFGLLDVTQRKLAREPRGFEVKWASLPEAARVAISEEIYSDGRPFNAPQNEAGKGIELGLADQEADHAAYSDPTTCAPLGIPPTSRVSFLVSTSTEILTSSSFAGAADDPRMTDLQSLALSAAEFELGDSFVRTDPKGWPLCRTKIPTLACRVLLPNGRALLARISFKPPIANLPKFTLDTLPLDLRLEFEARLKEARVDVKAYPPGFMIGNDPPLPSQS